MKEQAKGGKETRRARSSERGEVRSGEQRSVHSILKDLSERRGEGDKRDSPRMYCPVVMRVFRNRREDDGIFRLPNTQ